MSTQKFSASQREALWLAHERKCAYTREQLDVSSFHVDHILPEKLAIDPVAFAKVKAALELQDDFDLYGYENLLPCRSGANLQKGATIFDSNTTRFFLAIAASKKTAVQEYLEKIESRQCRGRVLILLQQCLQRGELSSSEVARLLEDYNERPQEIFSLVANLYFADATKIKDIAKADLEDLRVRPVWTGGRLGLFPDGLPLVKDGDQTLLVRTCKEYDSATRLGYFPASSNEIKTSAFFEQQCGLLNALEAATMPERSFIANPRVGITDLNLLPTSLFPWDDEFKQKDTKTTYQDEVTEGALIIKRVGQGALRIEPSEGWGQELIEVVRADFDGDGVEDILLFEYCYATGYPSYGGIRVITRTSDNGLFQIVSLTCSSQSSMADD